MPSTPMPHLKVVPAPAGVTALPIGGGGLKLDTFYREHSAYVAYIGIRILGRDDEIDDLVQDVFVQAVRGLATLRDPGAARGWLATVTVRVATRRLRVRRWKSSLGLQVPQEDTAWPGASPEQCATIARVYRVLETVPAKQRVAWILRMVERDPLDQVAEVCGCSLATVKRWIAAVQDVVTREVPHV